MLTITKVTKKNKNKYKIDILRNFFCIYVILKLSLCYICFDLFLIIHEKRTKANFF